MIQPASSIKSLFQEKILKNTPEKFLYNIRILILRSSMQTEC